MKRYLSYIGTLLAIASLGFLLRAIALHAGEIPPLQWDILTVSALLGVLLFYLSATFILFCIWSLILRNGGIDVPFIDAYSILGRAQIGKYLPGNIFHFVSRVTIGEQYGLPVDAIVVSMGIEMAVAVVAALLMVLLGVILNALSIPWLTSWFESHSVPVPKSILIAGVIMLTGLMVSSHRVRSWLKARLRYLHPFRIGFSTLIYVGILLANGIVILFLEGGIWRNASVPLWYQFSFGYSLAWLLGFIVPGAPGGIGIREAVFVALFSPALGEGVAAGLAIVLRIITSFSDLITFAIASWLGRKQSVDEMTA